MIGDEQQLRPKVNSYNLEKNYYFVVSLFERFVIQGLPKSTLLTKQRMRPEISKIIKSFYPDLIDHESVSNFPNIEGVSMNLFFFTHTIFEEKGTLSKENRYEAEMTVKFVIYLLNQKNYIEKDITVITHYKGQQNLIKNFLKN